ncbi:peptide/nickel transport system ATP-binding protein/oligopeptide transport system ATP-binding protein [Humitalea rosea]|uniref:Peptide/nickel transport system ATP-binding protein/oligopeptide transport system ATP-binding protein n=1 Tax=Humitalea rosea TaxID=990373 RepID=A0A2W7JVG1_9PROT|nr:oligopeptide/dipeptide ABC transporter ATP-binding protein [Humitalea rosea]PZW39440.1 peptide/nickel transport system ATP-binding protein/oligopeptide transport system ATP-binding protein [Humitalea rosea]
MRASDYVVLRTQALRKTYRVAGGRNLVAVDGVDIALHAGETLAIVGESGSGKSTVARCVLRLVEPTGGDIEVNGRSIMQLGSVSLASLYREVQMVFQDPTASLNPRMTVRQVLHEPLRLHLAMERSQREKRALALVDMVGLPAAHLDRYPHELSGGQRQRVGIARAIAAEPNVVILDEPTSSLDVSVRGQILDLLLRLQAELKLAYLFISHDLQVVRHVADRVAVMYLGGIVETGPAEAVFARPTHPYTRALLSAAPVAQWGVKRVRLRLIGEISSPIDPPDACRLVGRCPLEQPSCSRKRPPLLAVDAEHSAACPVVLGHEREAIPGAEALSRRSGGEGGATGARL